jgi:protease-4
LWWTLGILLAIGLIVASCSLPFYALLSNTSLASGGIGDSVAVIWVDGVIAGTGDVYSGYVTPDSFLYEFEQAEDDPSVKAILLRVDSPGGTVAASEEISEYVRTCEKPVVVSIGDVGASGAYMVSSQADEIWANPGSSVGSIGVIAEIPNVEKLLDTLGVEFQVITAGKYKDTGSPYRPLTEQERALIQGEVEEVYDQFIDIVAEGRDLERAKVEELATGWTWSGERAKELGLIDEVGTYRDALDSAAEKGGILGEYDIVTYEEDSFIRLFDSVLGLSGKLDELKALSDREGAIRRSVPR